MIGQKFRVRLAAKLLVMYLAVGATVSVSIGTVSYRTAEKAMTKNVYDNMDALATDVVAHGVGVAGIEVGLQASPKSVGRGGEEADVGMSE